MGRSQTLEPLVSLGRFLGGFLGSRLLGFSQRANLGQSERERETPAGKEDKSLIATESPQNLLHPPIFRGLSGASPHPHALSPTPPPLTSSLVWPIALVLGLMGHSWVRGTVRERSGFCPPQAHNQGPTSQIQSSGVCSAGS